jgi:hypothetical protein
VPLLWVFARLAGEKRYMVLGVSVLGCKQYKPFSLALKEQGGFNTLFAMHEKAEPPGLY